jgi:hypothetical protein
VLVSVLVSAASLESVDAAGAYGLADAVSEAVAEAESMVSSGVAGMECVPAGGTGMGGTPSAFVDMSFIPLLIGERAVEINATNSDSLTAAVGWQRKKRQAPWCEPKVRPTTRDSG